MTRAGCGQSLPQTPTHSRCAQVRIVCIVFRVFARARSATLPQPKSPVHDGPGRSHPVSRAILAISWAASSVGRAPPLHGGGQGFDSPAVHHVAIATPFSLQRTNFCVPGNCWSVREQHTVSTQVIARHPWRHAGVDRQSCAQGHRGGRHAVQLGRQRLPRPCSRATGSG